MEYLIIILLQVVGFGLHATKKIAELDKANPDIPIGEIKRIFWGNEWYTFISSGLILLLNLVVHLSIHMYMPAWREWTWFYVMAFGSALVLGWGGQDLAYRLLGKTQGYIEKKFDEKLEVK